MCYFRQKSCYFSPGLFLEFCFCCNLTFMCKKMFRLVLRRVTTEKTKKMVYFIKKTFELPFL